MALYKYKRFLDDSDEIVKKYFALKRKEKEREVFRKIGLDEYFQPVTSVIRQELKPFHKLIKNPPTGNNEELKEGVDPERYEEEDTWGAEAEDEEDEREIEEEDTWGAEAEDKDDDYFSPEEKLPGYGESLGFSNFRKLYSAYSTDEERNTDEFLDAYKATLKKNYNYKENRVDFSGLSLEDLKEKENELNKINSSANNIYNYNKKIIEIIEDVKNQKEEINKRKNLIIRMEHGKENKKTTRKKTIQRKKEIEEENTKMTDYLTKKRDMSGKGIGRGVKKGRNNSSLIYYNKPQQLIDRLRLLVGSKKAGNTNPEIDNEIIGISDELVKKGLIMNNDYTIFMKKNSIKF